MSFADISIEKLSVIVTGFAALLTALVAIITKCVDCWHQQKLKKLEVILERRIEVYERFINTATEFVYVSGGDGPEYLEFLRAYENAMIIASAETKKALKRVSLVANKLRSEEKFNKALLQQTDWYEAFEEAIKQMRKDISSLTKL